MISMSFLLSDYSIVWGSQMVGNSNVIAFSLHPIWFCLMMLVRKDEKNTVTMMTFLHLETCGEANSQFMPPCQDNTPFTGVPTKSAETPAHLKVSSSNVSQNKEE